MVAAVVPPPLAQELQDMMRIQHETQLKMDKALEQLIASKTAKEHLHQKVG